ncbi:phage holin family protein [Micromonospora sp. NPDC051006]|uniref:phage holin family protein n=1 Tax=Micromonospora sp. NPDC051006 TaxID=3364283 RepID=UPI0037BD6BFD
MADKPGGSPGAASADTPVPELVQRATDQITRLVRDELTMARAEMTAKGKRAGAGAGLLGGGATLGFYGGGVLVAAVVLALGAVIPDALAAVIVAVILLIAAAVAAQWGKKQVTKAMPPTPTETRDSVRADTETIRGAAGRRQP